MEGKGRERSDRADRRRDGRERIEEKVPGMKNPTVDEKRCLDIFVARGGKRK